MPGPVGRRRLPREVLTDHQRKKALAAAIELFARKGYPATTIDDLVEAGGIGVGSFYALFGGKEECLIAGFEAAVATVRRRVAAAAPGERWEDRVCAGLLELLEAVAADPVRARVALVEIQTAGAPALQEYENVLEEAALALSSGRDLVAADRRLPDSLEQTTVTGIALLLHRRLTMGESATIPELFEELAELILEPYLGDQRARAAIERMTVAPA